MWQIIGNLAHSLVGEPLKQWQKRKTLKVEQRCALEKMEHQAQITRAEALLEMAKQGQAQDYDLDKIALQDMKHSLKDELLLIIFLIPLVMAFIPGMDVHVQAGFASIEKMPEWYMAIVVGMVVTIYGLRGLLKSYLTRGFSLKKG